MKPISLADAFENFKYEVPQLICRREVPLLLLWIQKATYEFILCGVCLFEKSLVATNKGFDFVQMAFPLQPFEAFGRCHFYHSDGIRRANGFVLGKNKQKIEKGRITSQESTVLQFVVFEVALCLFKRRFR